ncbi:MAG: Maf family protein [Candidatus Eremiobacteraeota bacterium]|nr:Maf family protein [Candidatus Eremiobacteraeota bacterium]
MHDLVSIVLASGSPRRNELLRSLGLDVTVMPSEVSEGERPGLSPRALAAFYAAAKADAVFARVSAEMVVAADTVVDLDGRGLGKPAGSDDARAMLRALAGREHLVHTAYSVRSPQGCLDGMGSTRVRFAALSDDTIETYIAGGEPFDKAGGYGVQGRGAALVERIDGDFYTVMGFPLGDFIRRLPELALQLPRARPIAVPV